jgi:hypothetical protein
MVRMNDNDGYDDYVCFERQWIEDAPDLQVVQANVLMLVGAQVKRMEEQRLCEADHQGRMKLILAAQFYGVALDQVCFGHMPPGGRPVADLHLRFARMALEIPAPGEASRPLTAALEAMAEQCFVTRGEICEACDMPVCFHYNRGGSAGMHHCNRRNRFSAAGAATLSSSDRAEKKVNSFPAQCALPAADAIQGLSHGRIWPTIARPARLLSRHGYKAQFTSWWP